MPQNGLNKAQTWLNITGYIQGDMLKPFRPLESATGGCQKHPKMANFEPKKTVFGRFRGSLVTFFWGPNGPNWPPWMCLTMFNHVQPCSTMFNQCSTHLHLLGLLMAKYGHFGPKKAVFERFWGPLVTCFGPIKAQTDPPGCV